MRRRFPLHAERPFGEFPPTWRGWFLSLEERVGAVTGAPPADFLAIFLQRAPRTPPRASAIINRLVAFLRLWRQQWDAPLREERWRRRFAFVTSAVLNLAFLLMVVIFSIIQIGDAPPEAKQAGEATLIEYIGEGTPIEQGGAPATAETDAPAASGAGSAGQGSSASASASAASAAAPELDTTPRPPEPAEPASLQQPLVITETERPDIDFTLPAPTVQTFELPQLRVETPQLSTQVTEIETFNPTAQAQSLQQPTLRAPTLTVPTLRTQITEVEVYQPLSQTQVQALPVAPTRNPQLREQALRSPAGDVQLKPAPTPSPGAGLAPAAGTATASTATDNASGAAPSSGRSTAAPAATSGGKPQAQGAGRVAGVAPSGAGTTPSPKSGAITSTVRSDDWGNSNRNSPGDSTTAGRGNGLFNDDGSVRLPGGSGDAGGGLPPGTIIEDFEKIDRMGTWLKRPPLDYTPTRFDRFWLPSGSLLDEWVKRGVRNVMIPIPGTTKSIQCKVSLLQAGVGCRIYDPNLQDQEATARPPPDVPFKPELQEDQDAIRTP